MDFKTALKTVYETRNSDDELRNPFFIYSRMADIIGNSHEDKKKLSLFFTVEKRLNMLADPCELPFDDTGAMKRLYSDVRSLLPEKSFGGLVEAVAEATGFVTPAMDEKHSEPCADADSEDTSLTEPEEIESQAAEPEENAPSVDFEKSDGKVVPGLIVFFLINLAALVICGVLRLRWEAYQWVVGVTASAMLLAGWFMLFSIVDKLNLLVDDETVYAVVLCISVIANVVLFFVFGEAYYVVCYWVSGALIIFGFIAAYDAFDEFSSACGVIDVVACGVNVGIILLNVFL